MFPHSDTNYVENGVKCPLVNKKVISQTLIYNRDQFQILHYVLAKLK